MEEIAKNYKIKQYYLRLILTFVSKRLFQKENV